MAIIRYSDYEPKDKPSTRLHIYFKDRSIKTEGIIDSGADITSLPAKMAKMLLGIDLYEITDATIQRMGGISTTSECFCGDVVDCIMLPMVVALEPFHYRIPIEINWVLADIQPLIGRRDLFKCFRICIQEYDSCVEITPMDHIIDDHMSRFSQRRLERMEMIINKLRLR